ncbi:MAG: phosphoribosylanthranilate isomerase [Hyphomicrobiaceae bacterium]|nr:phosphoribosylanthranilate isomerase [Hyphomicrobiaceae bacterium]
MVKVKICGLKSAAALAAALDGGADYVGFVFYPPSPRSLSPQAAGRLAQVARGRAQIVALLVDPDDALIDEVVREVDPDLIQLHGGESPGRAAAIRKRSGRPVMKAISVESRADADIALDYRGAADLFLFDAKAPREMAGALPGGNGIAFDWHALDGVRGKVRFMLSGGLDPDNVAAAIRLTAPEVVDVSSGVETRPGEKDPRLIRLFLAAAKAECPEATATRIEARSE